MSAGEQQYADVDDMLARYDTLMLTKQTMQDRVLSIRDETAKTVADRQNWRRKIRYETLNGTHRAWRGVR